MVATSLGSETLALACEYARAVDDRNLELLTRVLHPQVRMAGPGFEMLSRAAFLESLRILDRYQRTYHLVGNHSGAWSGDEFRGETYCVASHLYLHEGATRKFDMAIRYADHILRQGGALVFRERVLNVVWTQDLPASLDLPA
jgi:hypothetical protein